MPGWTTGDNWHNNIGYTPGLWTALHQIAEQAGVGNNFRIHYDPSHAILMGQDTRSIFQYLRDSGYPFLIGGFHVKGQVIHSRGVAAWGYGGQTVLRGDRTDGKPASNPAHQARAWIKQTVLAEHELPGTARHDPLAYLQNRSVDWLDHQLAARELLDLKIEETHLVVEHEYPLTGASDHGVSEAIYLDDPDGNGVEIYRDRPREEWPRDADGGLLMHTRRLDLGGLLAEIER